MGSTRTCAAWRSAPSPTSSATSDATSRPALSQYRSRDELIYMTHNVPDRQIARFTLRDDKTLFFFVFRAGPGHTPRQEERKTVLRAGIRGRRMGEPADARGTGPGGRPVPRRREPGADRPLVEGPVLIGDAAACISLLGGEGTGLAMTEAYVLAGELHRAGADWRRAFNAHEALLRPLITSKQAGARRLIGFFATHTRFGLWFRNTAMRTMNFRPLATLFAGNVRDDIELPDYEM